ncbi:TPA: hypothetical protein EYN98_25705 [Candidatus Poribacteria bacterium]|nr:hypothetical protein [Candidatus Poribacteria bacterium]HIB88251.1 hypothetical protein [Candidatus Poribacteria bacterium]HIN29916.1 hypothetical protein [Candidatus Poribacteria bacterium]HIO47270.1 hypothetical protein [Candidatus Poribacteria bacterium]
MAMPSALSTKSASRPMGSTTDSQCHLLAKDFPPWQSVYYHYRKWCQEEKWVLIHRALHQQLPQQVGDKLNPVQLLLIVNR